MEDEMTDRALLERILSGEDGVLEAGSGTEYRWRFADIVLRALVTDGSPFRFYEYRFVRIADGSLVNDADAAGGRVREFVKRLLVSAGEDAQLLAQADRNCKGWTAVAVAGDAVSAEILCGACGRTGFVSRERWDALPRLGAHERQVTPEQHRRFFGNAV